MREVKYYIAEDGEKFLDKAECEEYEQKNKNINNLLKHSLCANDLETIIAVKDTASYSSNPITTFEDILSTYSYVYVPKELKPFLNKNFNGDIPITEGVIFWDDEEMEWLSLREVIEDKERELEELKDIEQEFLDYYANL